VPESVEIVDQTGDKAAAFHLARHFESMEDYQSAVKYFEKAGALDNAIRLAKVGMPIAYCLYSEIVQEHDMTDRLAHLSMLAGDNELVVEVAGYYEDKPGQADKAVMLYHKVLGGC